MATTLDTPGVTLRAAVDADLDDVEHLLTASGLPVVGVAESLNTFIVAESRGRVVGVVGLEVCCEHALLRSTAVSPEWRDHGLGRRLVERIIAEAESRDLRALYLLTTTAEHYFPELRIREDDSRSRSGLGATDRRISDCVPGIGVRDVPDASRRTSGMNMRYALISDIHANLPALEAVLADIAMRPDIGRHVSPGRPRWVCAVAERDGQSNSGCKDRRYRG